MTASRLYAGRDPREVPMYPVAEAAQYVRIPPSTLRSWVLGRTYPTKAGDQRFEPLIQIADPAHGQFSFYDLIEAHVLAAIRVKFGLRLGKVRKALDYLQASKPLRHPLSAWEFATDGVDLFVEAYGRLVNASKQGQIGMKDIVHQWLQRIDRDAANEALQFYPFTRTGTENQPKVVVIDSRISFGRPVLRETGIRTEVVWERYMAGESTADLADDYELEPSTIEEAIRAEGLRTKAA